MERQSMERQTNLQLPYTDGHITTILTGNPAITLTGKTDSSWL